MGRQNSPNYIFGIIIGKSILTSSSWIHGYMEDGTLYWPWLKVYMESCTQHPVLTGFYSWWCQKWAFRCHPTIPGEWHEHHERYHIESPAMAFATGRLDTALVSNESVLMWGYPCWWAHTQPPFLPPYLLHILPLTNHMKGQGKRLTDIPRRDHLIYLIIKSTHSPLGYPWTDIYMEHRYSPTFAMLKGPSTYLSLRPYH